MEQSARGWPTPGAAMRQRLIAAVRAMSLLPDLSAISVFIYADRIHSLTTLYILNSTSYVFRFNILLIFFFNVNAIIKIYYINMINNMLKFNMN